TDTTIAKMLLDECTLAAALRQLRIYNNSTSINELCAALNISAQDTGKLLEVYASFSSCRYFDEAFEEALAQLPKENLSDEEQARQSLSYLLKQADEIYAHSKEMVAQNRTDIFTLADKYHLSVKLTAELELLYSQPASIAIKEPFEQLFDELLKQNPREGLCASLAAQVLLLQITAKDAHDIAITSKLLNDELLEEDLMIIACRYLKAKTPQDIAAAFDAVLKRLPYVDNPEENLGLAVRVLLDGTPESFERASQAATLKRETELLRRSLSKNPLYNGFEYELATRFGGKKTFAQLEKEMDELLHNLPYCVSADENKELACKVLLGMLSQEEASNQASYMQGLKAVSLTQGLAPQVMKNYLGTQSAQELVAFFNKSLAPYSFWKSNQEKHIFALNSLVEELNGNYNHLICEFLLDMLESGSSVAVLADMLPAIEQKKDSPAQLHTLLAHYKQALAEAKSI
ncbi:MAG: hypothetical protein J6Q05_03145, partial [Elusimicrobiaceae bacterium]|nr:hypothetical protein [Elusimicrobiaceae bacterium]